MDTACPLCNYCACIIVSFTLIVLLGRTYFEIIYATPTGETPITNTPQGALTRGKEKKEAHLHVAVPETKDETNPQNSKRSGNNCHLNSLMKVPSKRYFDLHWMRDPTQTSGEE